MRTALIFFVCFAAPGIVSAQTSIQPPEDTPPRHAPGRPPLCPGGLREDHPGQRMGGRLRAVSHRVPGGLAVAGRRG